jgi:hypothetical protein
MIKPVGIVIVLILVPLQAYGVLYLLRMYWRHRQFFRNAMVTDGVVAGTREYSSGEGADFFARVFYTVAGTQYMIKDGIWTHSRRYKKDQIVKIYYLPESPGSGRIAEPWTPAILIGGAILIAAAIVIEVTVLLQALPMTVN